MMLQYNCFAVWLRAHSTESRGASLVEYALLVALISVLALAAIKAVGQGASENFNSITEAME